MPETIITASQRRRCQKRVSVSGFMSAPYLDNMLLMPYYAQTISISQGVLCFYLMNITTIKTPVVKAGETSLVGLLDSTLPEFGEGSILVITSKVVSLCESRVVDKESAAKDELIKHEADYYLDPNYSSHHYHFSIVQGMLTSSAGIDESNGNGNYVLWPRDPQATANEVRKYLIERFKVVNAGVIIVDSTSYPLRRGAIGTSIAHSGFKALNDYRGKSDLFGRSIKVEVANVCEGLAAGVVAVMGEGAEGTPIALIRDVDFVSFQNADPTPEEIAELRVALDDDYFASFLTSAPWQRGDHSRL
jgi:F420-0:gamma-glutamyl ligase